MCDCGDGPSALWERKPKAKKRHRCDECRGWIEAGEIYTATRGVWDGEAMSFKTCAECDELRGWAMDASEELCVCYGRMHHDILDDAYESQDAGYLAEAKAKIQAIKTKRREPIAA